MYVRSQRSGIFTDWGKNRTNCQFFKTRLDALTEAQKENVSGETQTCGNRICGELRGPFASVVIDVVLHIIKRAIFYCVLSCAVMPYLKCKYLKFKVLKCL